MKKELTIEITAKCDRNCWWCSSDATPDGQHADADEVLRWLWANHLEYPTVRISGGEPTLHPKINKILMFAKTVCNYRVVLLTNGQKACASEHVDEYYISFLGEASLNTALELKAMRKPVVLTTVLGVGRETETIAVATAHDFPVHLYRLQLQGRAVKHDSLADITLTGERGCNRNNKKTIQVDGTVIGCSGEKYGHQCDVCR